MNDPQSEWKRSSQRPDAAPASDPAPADGNPPRPHRGAGSEAPAPPLKGRPHGNWSVVTPLHYEPAYRYPLIVWLHHSGHNERQIDQVLPHISVRNYIGVGVRGTRAVDLAGHRFDWPSGNSAIRSARDAVLQAIDEVRQEYSIHDHRVVLAGYQSGASMACRIAMMTPDRFAGVVRLGGRFPAGGGLLGDFERLRQRRLPMLWQQAINGVDDDPDRLRSDLVTAQTIRAKVEVRQYRGDEVMNRVALRDIDRWCFEQIISPSPPKTLIGGSGGGAEMHAHETSPLEFSSN